MAIDEASNMLKHSGGGAATQPVHIIVPVYNGLSHLQVLLHSLIPDLDRGHRLVLIDDCSPDPAVVPVLRKFAARFDEQVTLIERPVNGGFIKTMNDGFTVARGTDCVVLNADTVVGGEWLQVLRSVSCEDTRFGIVMPTSNNASIFSVPEMADIAALTSVETVGAGLFAAFGTASIDVPTAVGFCMFVRADVLTLLGGFDEAFGRGYGEENEFCQRARMAGFRLRLALGAYVEHEGGVSMVEAGVRSKEHTTVPANERLLQRMHPNYLRDINDPAFRFFLARTLESVRHVAVDQLLRSNGCVIHLMHVDPFGESVGGVELHVRDLINKQRFSKVVVVVRPNSGLIQLDVRFGGASIGLLSRIPAQSIGTVSSGTASAMLASLLIQAFHASSVHVHHLIGYGLDFPVVARSLGLRVILTLHDYYLASPTITLLDGQAEPHQTNRIENYFGVAEWTVDTWTRASRAALEACEFVIAPSRAAQRVLVDNLEAGQPDRVAEDGSRVPGATLDQANFVVRPHPRPSGLREGWQHRVGDTVVFLGSIHRVEKGVHLIKELIGTLVDRGVKVSIIGSTARELSLQEVPGTLSFVGRYRADEVGTILGSINPACGVLASPWEETYGYTLTELQAMSIPAVVGPYGAPAERIRLEGGGVVVDDYAAAAFAEAIQALLADPQALGSHSATAARCTAELEPLSTYSQWLADLYGPKRADAEAAALPTWALIVSELQAASINPTRRSLKEAAWPYIPEPLFPALVRAKRLVKNRTLK